VAPPKLRYANLDDFKVYASLTDQSDLDPMLQSVLAGAEEFVERYTRRRFAIEPPLNPDTGEDTEPSVRKRFTTRGRTVVRIPDLRVVDNGAGGVIFYGRTLYPITQYYLGPDGYGDEADWGGEENASDPGQPGIGPVVQHNPATEITLGYGYGTGYGISGQFAYVLPLGYRANDLEIWGRWGWYPTPPSILDGTYAIAARRYRERDASWSDTVVTPAGGAMQYLKQMPSSVKAELDSFRVPNWSMV
jgi:hypothetical protein